MSKIAEKKALEAYPRAYYRNGGGIDDANACDRAVYEEGYDQAMQDFLEKAEKFWRQNLNEQMVYLCKGTINDAIEQFKNYMENESEN